MTAGVKRPILKWLFEHSPDKSYALCIKGSVTEKISTNVSSIVVVPPEEQLWQQVSLRSLEIVVLGSSITCGDPTCAALSTLVAMLTRRVEARRSRWHSSRPPSWQTSRRQVGHRRAQPSQQSPWTTRQEERPRRGNISAAHERTAASPSQVQQ